MSPVRLYSSSAFVTEGTPPAPWTPTGRTDKGMIYTSEAQRVGPQQSCQLSWVQAGCGLSAAGKNSSKLSGSQQCTRLLLHSVLIQASSLKVSTPVVTQALTYRSTGAQRWMAHVCGKHDTDSWGRTHLDHKVVTGQAYSAAHWVCWPARQWLRPLV